MWLKQGALFALLFMLTSSVLSHERGTTFASLSDLQKDHVVSEIKDGLCEDIVIEGMDLPPSNTCDGLDLEAYVADQEYIFADEPPTPIYVGEVKCTPVKDIIGIGRKRSEALLAVGLGCVRQLIAADPDKVAEVAGVSRDRVDQWQSGVKVWLEKEGSAREK